MWQLNVTDSNREWTNGGMFETLTAATAAIIANEGLTKPGIHLEFYVDVKFGTDAENLSYFEYSGKRAIYGIKRMVQ